MLLARHLFHAHYKKELTPIKHMDKRFGICQQSDPRNYFLKFIHLHHNVYLVFYFPLATKPI